MSDLTLREPMLPEPSRGDLWIIWTGLASLLLHAGLLAVLLWQPLPESLEAEQPPAIDVQLVPPPDEAASEPPAGGEAAKDEPAAQPAGEAAAESEAAPEATEEPAPAESSPAEQPQAPASSRPEATQPAEAEAAAEEPPPTEPAETASAPPEAAEPPATETTATEAPEPQQAPQATAKVAPVPLARPKVRALEAPADAEAAAAEPTPETGAAVAGAVVAATPEEPDVTTLQLGDPRDAERFYLEAMLSTPRLAPAREMLKTLPAEKRLAQTCNIEALAQIGYSGEGFAPDVVMAEAYALQEITGTRLVANGAIFRSGEKWYGLAFDCTLSDDLSTVTAFTYRLGADVTEAVLKRLEKN